MTQNSGQNDGINKSILKILTFIVTALTEARPDSFLKILSVKRENNYTHIDPDIFIIPICLFSFVYNKIYCIMPDIQSGLCVNLSPLSNFLLKASIELSPNSEQAYSHVGSRA